MGCNPNTILIASIRPPNGQPDEFLNALDPEWESEGSIQLDQLRLTHDGHYQVVVGEDNDQGIYPKEDSFAVYDYLTYGWGDEISLDEFDDKVLNFKALVQNFCHLHKCTYSISLRANFW